MDLLNNGFFEIVAAGDRIEDVVDVVWGGAHQVRFLCKKEDFPRSTTLFKRFCDVLVFNYLVLLLPHNPAAYLQLRPPTDVRWTLERTCDGLHLWLEDSSGNSKDLGTVTNRRAAARTARGAGHEVVTIDPRAAPQRAVCCSHPGGTLSRARPASLLALCRRLLLAGADAATIPPATDGDTSSFSTAAPTEIPVPASAVVVRTNRRLEAPHLVWSVAMSLTAATNSNNQAEYLGLAIGLAAADRHQWRPFEVVGDSTLIIRQLQHYRPPKPDRLLPLYRVARHLVDKLGVERWHHYLRAYNKMADTAANVAMDGRHSIHSFAPVLPPGMGQD